MDSSSRGSLGYSRATATAARGRGGVRQVQRTCRWAAPALAALAIGCSDLATQGPDVIRIGLAGPMDASYGRSVRAGAELAVERINERGGIDGRTVELVIRDDQADPARAIEIAGEFVQDPSVVGVVGHVNSGTTRAAAAVYNDPARPLLAISPTATSPELSEAGPWTFRVCATDLRHGPALAEWALEGLGRDRALVLYANEEYGRGILASFSEAFRAGGGTVVSDDPYLVGLLDSTEVLRPYLRRAMQRGANVLLLAGELDVAVPAVELARSMGFNGPMLGGDGLIGLEQETPAASDVYISTGFLPDQPGAEAQQFVQAYSDRFGALPSGDAALTYDAVTLLAVAIEAAGTDRNALRDHVASIGSSTPPFRGATGEIAFDENGDARDKTVAIGTVRNGRLVSAAAAGVADASAP